MSAPLQWLAWKAAGPAASSAVLSSKCLLTWAQPCLSFGMGPGERCARRAPSKTKLLANATSLQQSIPEKGAPPRGPAVFGGAKQGHGTPKVGGGWWIYCESPSTACRGGLIFTRAGSQRSAGLAWPFLCSNVWPHANCQPGTTPALCYLPNHGRERHSSGLL